MHSHQRYRPSDYGIAENAILENWGKKIVQNGKEAYVIRCDF